MEFTDLDSRIAIVADPPGTHERRSTRGIRIREILRIDARANLPMIVDPCRRRQAEHHIVAIAVIAIRRLVGSLIPWMVVLVALAVILPAQLAREFDLIRIALEIGHAHTEAVEFRRELRGKLVDECLVGSRYVLFRHGLRYHLRHLVTRDILTALEGRIPITFDDAIMCQRRHSIIGPMVRRHVAERVGRCKRRGCSTTSQGRNKCGCDGFLHVFFSILTSNQHIPDKYRLTGNGPMRQLSHYTFLASFLIFVFPHLLL